MTPPSLQVSVWATAHSSLRMGILEEKSGKESSAFSFVLFLADLFRKRFLFHRSNPFKAHNSMTV